MPLRTVRRWRGKPLAELTDAELTNAIDLVRRVNDELANHAPADIWVFFADAYGALTIEQARRMGTA